MSDGNESDQGPSVSAAEILLLQRQIAQTQSVMAETLAALAAAIGGSRPSSRSDPFAHRGQLQGTGINDLRIVGDHEYFLKDLPAGKFVQLMIETREEGAQLASDDKKLVDALTLFLKRRAGSVSASSCTCSKGQSDCPP